jgi:hypothetical protein
MAGAEQAVAHMGLEELLAAEDIASALRPPLVTSTRLRKVSLPKL